MPIGLGKAISNSFPSPSPFTLTTVPIPHFLCDALSPTAQPISSPPVADGAETAFPKAGTFLVEAVEGDPVLEELKGVCLALGAVSVLGLLEVPLVFH